MKGKTISDILRTIREGMPQKMESLKNGELVVLDTAKLADCIEEAYRREFDEAARTLDKLAEGICSHCDMQRDCAEGEDGMSTMCNAMYGVRKFIEEHKKEDK